MCNGAYSGTFTFRNNCGRCFSAALVSGKTKKAAQQEAAGSAFNLLTKSEKP